MLVVWAYSNLLGWVARYVTSLHILFAVTCDQGSQAYLVFHHLGLNTLPLATYRLYRIRLFLVHLILFLSIHQ